MNTIILFYKYVEIAEPVTIKKWQQKICNDLSLKGRIILAREGINGTLEGNLPKIEQYKLLMNNHPLFNDIDFKESAGSSECFPRLRVVVKNEIVHFGIDHAKAPAKNA